MTLENIINGFKRIAVTGILGLSLLSAPACGEPEGNGSSGGCVSNVECHAPRVCYRGECVDEEDVPENNDDNNVNNNSNNGNNLNNVVNNSNNVNNGNNSNNGYIVDDDTAVVSCKNPESQDNLRDLYLLNLTNHELTRITTGSDEGFDDIWPVFSPDRTHISFKRDKNSKGPIYLLFLKEKQLENVESLSEYCLFPRWSSKDELGVYCFDTEVLYVLNPRSKDILHTIAINHPSYDWSPDGDKIIYSFYDEFIIENIRNETRYVIENIPSASCRDPSWSSFGIAFNCADDESESFLYTMNEDGSNIRQWTELEDHKDRSPSWSPDGSKIIFSRFGALEEGIYTLNLQSEQIEEVPLPLKCSLPFWSH